MDSDVRELDASAFAHVPGLSALDLSNNRIDRVDDDVFREVRRWRCSQFISSFINPISPNPILIRRLAPPSAASALETPSTFDGCPTPRSGPSRRCACST